MIHSRSPDRRGGPSPMGCRIDCLVNGTDMVWEYFFKLWTSIQFSSHIWTNPNDRFCCVVKYITGDK